MANSGYYKRVMRLLVSLVFIYSNLLLLSAQTPDLFTITDTSYFKAGEDDWNLVESVLKGNHANVLHLIKRGADPNAKAEGGMTALMYAAEQGDTMLVKLLVLNGADLELTFIEGTSPLQIAVLNHHFEVTHFLLEKGADPDHQDDLKGTALLYAAAINDYRIADLLLFYGASDTLRDKDGNDALMTAVYFGHLETADVLLQNQFSPDTRDKKKNTPLMVAVQQGNKEMTELLLEFGAGTGKVNENNYTPLAHGIHFHQDTTAMILIDSGANIHHKIAPNRNLYDLAVQQHQKKIREELKKRGAGPTAHPDFTVFEIGLGNSFRNNEHLMQVRFTLLDRKFGYFAETGFDFRPIYRKVQVNEEDQLILQFRESRWIWTHGAGKYFRLFTDSNGFEYGAYGGLYGMLSRPKYRGINDHPPLHYALMPTAGLYLKGRIAGIKAGAERYHFGTLYEDPWKMNITLFFRISSQQVNHAYKEIQY